MSSYMNKLNGFAVYKTVGELQEGETYKIKKLAVKETEYGQALEAILEAEDGEKIRTFLPKRYRECFTDEDIQLYDGEYSYYSFHIATS